MTGRHVNKESNLDYMSIDDGGNYSTEMCRLPIGRGVWSEIRTSQLPLYLIHVESHYLLD